MTLLRAPGQTRTLAPDAGARLLRLRDEHQSPLLHRKETFPPPGHELVAKFAQLTHQKEKHGLLDETATIGTRGVGKAAGGGAVSRFGGIGYCGKEVKRGNHEIDEICEKKQ